MKYNKLGNTDIDVSVICLGTMTYGEQNTIEEAHSQLDFAIERGINFIDTAEMYPVPPKADTAHLTEEYIGKWGKLHTDRSKIILATKVVGRSDWLDHIRGREACLNEKNIIEAVEGSLKRLKTDYIDLYQLHWPDRKTNFFGIRGFTPSEKEKEFDIEETLRTLKKLTDSGKIKYVGLSNDTPWGTMEFLRLAQKYDLPRVVSVQNPYSLLNRTYEVGMAEVSYREKCGLLAYSPLGFGVLSGKYLGGNSPEGSRLNLWGDRFTRYSNPNAVEATTRYVELAKKYGMTPSQLALAFVNTREFVTSNIIGATNLDQLAENISSVDINLSSELLEELEQIHQNIPNPSP